jgi:hypothetical protein
MVSPNAICPSFLIIYLCLDLDDHFSWVALIHGKWGNPFYSWLSSDSCGSCSEILVFMVAWYHLCKTKRRECFLCKSSRTQSVVQLQQIQVCDLASLQCDSWCRIHSKREKIGNEQYMWHGTTRACNIGDDNSQLYPCQLSECRLCPILRATLDPTKAGSSYTTILIIEYYETP